MSERWHEFLEDQGLVAGPDGYTHTDAEKVDAFQKLSGETLCDLTHQVLVHAGGEDSGEFLQNQLTNDVESLDHEHATVAGYCNPKGRLICLFRIWRDADGFILQLPADLQEAAIDRLRKYVLRARVQLSVDPDRVAFGVCGKTVAKALEGIAGKLPTRDNTLVRSGDLTILRIAGDERPRFQVVGPASGCITVWQKLSRHATMVGSWTWARVDILAGIPSITAATTESFIPQMVNLDRLDAVNFKKGCYPGQEIVARMHYLGNLKQRMGRFRVDDGAHPKPGDRVFAKDGGSASGTVVDAQPGAGSDWDLLAVVRIADLDQHTLYLGSENGEKMFRQGLPYEVTGES